MDLIGSNRNVSRVVYPLFGAALLLLVACGTAAPPAQDTGVNEVTAPTAKSMEDTASATSSVAVDSESADKMSPTSSAEAMDTESADKSASESPADAMEASYPIGNDVGERIPDFTMTLLDGSTVTASDLRAEKQPAFLFFFETW